jgi:hypothetical protein
VQVSNLPFDVICLSKRGLPRRRKSIGGPHIIPAGE